MDRVAATKVHFAPYQRQASAIRRLLRDRRYRNVSHFMRSAIDEYLARLGRPPLVEQARQMADDHERAEKRRPSSRQQDASRATSERW